MKAADIPDSVIYELVRQRKPLPGSLYDMQGRLAATFPAKVVFAKVRQMVNKGRLEGCPCGCRGDFEIPVDTKQHAG